MQSSLTEKRSGHESERYPNIGVQISHGLRAKGMSN